MAEPSAGKRLVLFDIDGTLLHPDGVGRRATQAAMLEVFGTADGIDSHHFAGKSDWHTLTVLLRDSGYTREAIGQQMARYDAAIERHIERFIPDHKVRALPGAIAAVQRLYEDPDSTTGLVTGNMPRSARSKLRAAGFDPAWFNVGAFGSESTDRNELTRLAVERGLAYCGQPIPSDHVYIIGDTVMDIAGARSANGVAVVVRTGFEDNAILAAAGPDYLLDDLTALFDVL
jgi:phosphoglycolate phosphatase